MSCYRDSKVAGQMIATNVRILRLPTVMVSGFPSVRLPRIAFSMELLAPIEIDIFLAVLKADGLSLS